MARFNRQVSNHLTRPLAHHLPGFGVIVHHGRRSGRFYGTPVNVFRRSDGYVVALTYGAGADWVRNLVTAGVCDLITHGRRMRVVVSHIEHDEQLLPVPTIVRPILRLIHVVDFLHLARHSRGMGPHFHNDGFLAGERVESGGRGRRPPIARPSHRMWNSRMKAAPALRLWVLSMRSVEVRHAVQ